MQQVTLLPRIYGQYQNRLFSVITNEIESLTTDLESEMHYRITRNNRVQIDISGDDTEFVYNVLVKKYGKATTLQNTKIDTRYSGQLIDTGKVGYGLYCDIGIIGQKKSDALIPLHRLRQQFNMEKASLREIIGAYVLADNMPLEIKLLDADLTNMKLDAILSDSTVKRYEEWVTDDHERLIVLGVTQKMIESALRKTKHSTDIYSIEPLGFFEYALQCKRSTRASGIVSSIGPYLKGVPIHLFIPQEVEAKRDAAS
jgi:hypothetical protein